MTKIQKTVLQIILVLSILTIAADHSAKAAFENLCSSFYAASSNDTVSHTIDVEIIDKCLQKLKQGKASGPDDLTSEHLIYAHPYLIVLLCDLFTTMIHNLFQMVLVRA